MNKKIKITIFICIVILIGAILYILFIASQSPHDTSTYRNGRRLIVISRLQTYLELYFKDHKKYPNDLQELVPKYGTLGKGTLGKFPDNFVIKDPACGLQEPYEYYTKNNSTDYMIIFCLPEKDPLHSAGYHIATSQGIK